MAERILELAKNKPKILVELFQYVSKKCFHVVIWELAGRTEKDQLELHLHTHIVYLYTYTITCGLLYTCTPACTYTMNIYTHTYTHTLYTCTHMGGGTASVIYTSVSEVEESKVDQHTYFSFLADDFPTKNINLNFKFVQNRAPHLQLDTGLKQIICFSTLYCYTKSNLFHIFFIKNMSIL